MIKTLNNIVCILLFTAGLASTDLKAALVQPSISVETKVDSKQNDKASSESSSTDEQKSYEQIEYEMAVQHAVVSYRLLKNSWPLKFPKQALKDKKPFDRNASNILTLHTQTLLSINAPMYEVEIPELYAMWKDAFDLMDEAETKKLYTPPENLRSILSAWRAKKAISVEIDAAPWIKGPAIVSIEANLEPITIPLGFRFLPASEHTALNERIIAIKNTAIKKEKINMPLFVDDKRISTNWLMPIESQSWSADIIVVSNGHTAIDTALPNSELLINQIMSRLDPVSSLKMQDTGKFSRKAVRWLIAPEQDRQHNTIRWANTVGMVNKPLGINFTHIKLGANQQLLLNINNLEIAENFVTAEYLPEGKSHDNFKAENHLKQLTTNLAPLFNSLQFVAGKRLEDAKESDIQNTTPVEYLITGAPSIMELGVKQMIAEQERKENFWNFLQDHPRYQATFISLLIVLLLSLKAGIDKWIQQDDVWLKVFKKTLGLLSVITLVVGGFLIWLNLHLK